MMTPVAIPSLSEIGAGISFVADGACELASSAVQNFVTQPSTAQLGLNIVASQIEILEQLVVKLREVSAGIEQVHDKLATTAQLEWHSPAGNVFRESVGARQDHAKRLRDTSAHTATLASQGIDELRIMISALQSLLAAARSSVGAAAGTTVARVCS